MQYVTKDIIGMAAIRTHFPELAMKKQGKASVKDIDRMLIVREAGVAYPTVVRWLNGDIDRFDGDTVKRFCIWLNCEIGELLSLDDNDPE